MYKEFTEFVLDDMYYNSQIRGADRILENTIIESLTNYESYHYLTEAKKESLWLKLKKFIVSAMEIFHSFKQDFRRKIEETIKKKQLKSRLNDMKNKLSHEKSLGMKTVTYPDLQLYEKKYAVTLKKLTTIHKRVIRMKYKSVDQINADLKEFDTIMDSFEKESDEIFKNKKIYPIDNAIKFVESEISGSSNMINTLDQYDSMLKDMASSIDLMEKKTTILGDDIIPHHVGFLRKIVTKIGQFIKRCVVKFITTVVFIFA